MKSWVEYERLKAEVDEAIVEELSSWENISPLIKEASLYAVKDGGKRIRPVLLLWISERLGIKRQVAMRFAVALELIHSYSLVHDDLPAMDDDDWRRGKPTVHKKFGEAVAILVGDALLNGAYETVFRTLLKDGSEKNILAANYLAAVAGYKGMIGGQDLDIQGEFATRKDLDRMVELKTCRLLQAAFVIPGYLSELKDEELQRLEEAGRKFGMLFQYTDDVEDKEQDESMEKVTILAYVSEKSLREELQEIVEELQRVEILSDSFFNRLIDQVAKRG